MIVRRKTLKVLVAALALLFAGLGAAGTAAAYQHSLRGGADPENCLMCHKFPGLARVDENLELRLLFINEQILRHGPHARAQCGDCHSDVDRVPHGLPVDDVNCLKECHVIEPSTGNRFTHQRVQDFMNMGIHSRYDADGNLKEHSEDFPLCIDCHWDEPIYEPVSLYKGTRYEGLDERAMERCISCHEGAGFTESFYSHVTSRLDRTRTAQQVKEMCSNCHDDPGIIERHGLKKAVYSYKETFHGKWTSYGGIRQPDCADCHSSPGESVHLIRAQQDRQSSIHPDNRQATCSQVGCHEGAGKYVGEIGVHIDTHLPEYIVERYVFYFFTVLLAGTLISLFVLMILEQIRGIFPDAALIKEREKYHDN